MAMHGKVLFTLEPSLLSLFSLYWSASWNYRTIRLNTWRETAGQWITRCVFCLCLFCLLACWRKTSIMAHGHFCYVTTRCFHRLWFWNKVHSVQIQTLRSLHFTHAGEWPKIDTERKTKAAWRTRSGLTHAERSCDVAGAVRNAF